MLSRAIVRTLGLILPERRDEAGQARELDGRFPPAPTRVPESDDLDLAGFCVDLVVEVVASAAQKQAANRVLLRIASSRPDPRLGRDELEGSFEIIDESEWGGRTVRSPPS